LKGLNLDLYYLKQKKLLTESDRNRRAIYVSQILKISKILDEFTEDRETLISMPVDEVELILIDLFKKIALPSTKIVYTPHRYRKKKKVKSSSGIKGITWYKPRSRWMAYINVKGTAITIGYYKTIEEAVIAKENYIKNLKQ
jgi:hypothetical protein